MNPVFSDRIPNTNVALPSNSVPYIVALVVGGISLSFGVFWLSALGLSACAYYLLRLVLDAGADLPIESFILVMASGQWILGPVLTYAGLSDHYKYYMYVPEDEYMTLVVPAVILYSIGLYSFRSRSRIVYINHNAAITRDIVSRAGFLPAYLIAVGVVFSFVSDMLPPSLAFPGYVLANIKYIGLIYLIFSDRQENKAAILLVAFALTLASSLRTTMFHDLILWTAFVGMYLAYIYRPGLARKVLMAGLGLLMIFTIQAVKDDYRSKREKLGYTTEVGVESFVQSIEDRFEANEKLRANNIERMVVRMNQGWIISRIMQQVPSRVPHAHGQTIITAAKSSVLPRILYPDKPEAGGKENYEKYTGYYLGVGTSMGISLLGEAYINFGVRGAWVFMFIFGLISSWVIKRIFLLSQKYPTIWLWIPLILFHFVKAETELLVQLNFLVKALVLVYLFVWANKHFFRLKL